jgi:SAM-dependent methyltransferase
MTDAELIAEFFNIPPAEAQAKLALGFHAMHKRVAEDFRRAAPKTDEELLEWYRQTEAYIWELTAYHGDPGFNYAGMCRGIAEHLDRLDKPRVLCLGDGVGDLTLTLWHHGLQPTYHDLQGSKTAEFAIFKLTRVIDGPGRDSLRFHMTQDWEPTFPELAYDAVVALDFLEHLPDVEAWCRAIYRSLVSGGETCFQNAFSIGSGSEGSIPCHLSTNDHWTEDWEPLMRTIGFVKQPSGWWAKL